VTSAPFGQSHGADDFQSHTQTLGHNDNVRAYGSPLARQESIDRSPRSEEEGLDHSQPDTANSVLFSKTLFVGSPGYKKRRQRSRKRSRRAGTATTGYDTEGSGSEPDMLQQSNHVSNFPDWSFQPNGGNMRPTSINHGNFSTQRLDQPLAVSNQQLAAAIPMTSGSPLIGSASRGQDLMRFNSDEYAHMSSPPTSSLRPSKEAITVSSAMNTPGKGFTCPLIPCARVFKRLEHLKRHVRTHTQERPFGCDRCPKRFSRSDNLTQHLKTHEKADRGERMKTELSESGVDEHYMGPELDAIPSRGHAWSELGQPGLPSRFRHSTHDGSTSKLLLRSMGTADKKPVIFHNLRDFILTGLDRRSKHHRSNSTLCSPMECGQVRSPLT